MTFLFGNRLLPFDEQFSADSASVFVKMRIAASMGYYESGLWTILAVLGVAGGVLYILVFVGLLRPIIRPLLQHRICDYTHAFYFLAAAGTAVWLTFSWIAGHFPSQELLMAVIARAAYEDQKRRAESEGAAMPHPASRIPHPSSLSDSPLLRLH
jgi:hypothetical protein